MSYHCDYIITALIFFLCFVAEIPEEPKGATGYAAIAVFILVFMGFIFALLILCRRKKGLSLLFFFHKKILQNISFHVISRAAFYCIFIQCTCKHHSDPYTRQSFCFVCVFFGLISHSCFKLAGFFSLAFIPVFPPRWATLFLVPLCEMSIRQRLFKVISVEFLHCH